MKARLPAALAALAVLAAGCAAPGRHAAAPGRAHVVAGRDAAAAATPGRTRADVAAALGEAQVIRFHSGFEVWVYRLAADNAHAASPPASVDGGELVILFTPDGVVARTRVRERPRGEDG